MRGEGGSVKKEEGCLFVCLFVLHGPCVDAGGDCGGCPSIVYDRGVGRDVCIHSMSNGAGSMDNVVFFSSPRSPPINYEYTNRQAQLSIYNDSNFQHSPPTPLLYVLYVLYVLHVLHVLHLPSPTLYLPNKKRASPLEPHSFFPPLEKPKQ